MRQGKMIAYPLIQREPLTFRFERGALSPQRVKTDVTPFHSPATISLVRRPTSAGTKNPNAANSKRVITRPPEFFAATKPMTANKHASGTNA